MKSRQCRGKLVFHEIIFVRGYDSLAMRRVSAWISPHYQKHVGLIFSPDFARLLKKSEKFSDRFLLIEPIFEFLERN